jgi:hypothetical protein
MPMKLGDWELSERESERLAESRRRLFEEVERKKAGGVQNGAEALEAFRNLFESDKEMEEFGRYIQRMREEERARYRD